MAKIHFVFLMIAACMAQSHFAQATMMEPMKELEEKVMHLEEMVHELMDLKKGPAPTKTPKPTTPPPTTTPPPPELCGGDGEPGACVANCGAGQDSDCPEACNVLGVPFISNNQCNAGGGGGRACPPTFVCCTCAPA